MTTVDLVKERESAQAELLDHLIRHARWFVPQGSDAQEYGGAMGWRHLGVQPDGAELLAREVMSDPHYLLAEYADGGVTIFGFDSREGRQAGIGVLTRWHLAASK